MKYQEPLKQYVWESVAGASSPADAVRILNIRLQPGVKTAVPHDLKPIGDAIHEMGKAYGQLFSVIADAVNSFVDGFHEAFADSSKYTKDDFEVAR